MKLKWLISYETIRFDTADGDLDRDEYAVNPKGGWFVRKHPKNNHQFVKTNDPDDIEGKKRVGITDMKGAYYDEFELPDKRRFRTPSSRQKYDGLRYTKRYPHPEKEISSEEINLVTRDDYLWQ